MSTLSPVETVELQSLLQKRPRSLQDPSHQSLLEVRHLIPVMGDAVACLHRQVFGRWPTV